MWKLTIEDDQGQRTTVSLVRQSYSIGRADENALRLTERNVSRRHATLRLDGLTWVVEDHDSDNGTWVQGQRVQGRQELASGDQLRLGDYRLVVLDEDATQVGAEPQFDDDAASGRSFKPNRLVVLDGPSLGAEYPLTGTSILLGRDPTACQIVVAHETVSRVHAELAALGDGRWELRDLESAHGIRVNGVPLRAALLDAHDVIELGSVPLKLVPQGESLRPPPDYTGPVPVLSLEPPPTAADAAPAASGDRLPLPVLVGATIGAVGLLAVAAIVLLSPAPTEPESEVTAIADPRASAAPSAALLAAGTTTTTATASATTEPDASAEPTSATTDNAPRTASADGPSAKVPLKPAAPKATSAVDEAASGTDAGEVSAIRSLEAKIRAGTATDKDKRLHSALCRRHAGVCSL